MREGRRGKQGGGGGEGGREGGKKRMSGGKKEGREAPKGIGRRKEETAWFNWVGGSVHVFGLAGGMLTTIYSNHAGPSTPPEILEGHCPLSYRAQSENSRGTSTL